MTADFFEILCLLSRRLFEFAQLWVANQQDQLSAAKRFLRGGCLSERLCAFEWVCVHVCVCVFLHTFVTCDLWSLKRHSWRKEQLGMHYDTLLMLLVDVTTRRCEPASPSFVRSITAPLLENATKDSPRRGLGC